MASKRGYRHADDRALSLENRVIDSRWNATPVSRFPFPVSRLTRSPIIGAELRVSDWKADAPKTPTLSFTPYLRRASRHGRILSARPGLNKQCRGKPRSSGVRSVLHQPRSPTAPSGFFINRRVIRSRDQSPLAADQPRSTFCPLSGADASTEATARVISSIPDA